MRYSIPYALVGACHIANAFAFVPGVGLLCNTQQFRVSPVCSAPTHRPTCMVASEQDGMQTRAEAIESLTRVAALTLGATQILTSTAAVAEEVIVTKSGLKIKKVVNGSGPGPNVGDLVGVKFKGTYNSFEFDNIFGSAEPYYMRAGVGTLVEGVEEAILMMHVGDKWELQVPAKLAFGNKGRPPSPGRPRIPPGADVEFLIELVSLPGKEDDILNLLEEPLTGDAFDSA